MKCYHLASYSQDAHLCGACTSPACPGRKPEREACHLASRAVVMRLATFDVYPKTLQEFRQRTVTGAAVSLACSVLIALLTIVEVTDYLQVKVDDHLFVDTSRGQQLRINMNISFPALPCSVIDLDTLDVSGNHAANIMQNINKWRLDANGNRMDDPPPSPPSGKQGYQRMHPTARRLLAVEDDGEPSATIDGKSQPIKLGKLGGGGPLLLGKLGGGQAFQGGDLLLSKLLSELLPGVFEDKEAVAELRAHVGEGCHLDGYMLVNKVAGNFHFALNKADHHVRRRRCRPHCRRRLYCSCRRCRRCRRRRRRQHRRRSPTLPVPVPVPVRVFSGAHDRLWQARGHQREPCRPLDLLRRAVPEHGQPARQHAKDGVRGLGLLPVLPQDCTDHLREP